MILDDKKIEAAARRYSEVTDCDKEEALLIEEGFKEGAKWAIKELLKNLWHPASEEPNHESIRTYILGKTKASESGILPMLLRPNTNWKEFVVSHGVTHWLYVDDLFPKKGGEQ